MSPKICFAAAAVFILLLNCESYPQTTPHNNFKLKENSGILADSQKIQLTEKNPVLAGTLSFILPGIALGQIYNNIPSKVIRHLGISAGCVTLLALASEFNWFQFSLACGASNHDTWILYGIVFTYIGNWIWSIADASVTANEINKQVMLQKFRSDLINKFGFGFSYDKNKKLNLKFSVRL